MILRVSILDDLLGMIHRMIRHGNDEAGEILMIRDSMGLLDDFG